MDIIKLHEEEEEEDEDETMHSGADVEAFTAVLKRDIQGHTSTSSHSSQITNAPSGVFPPGSNSTTDQLYSQWQNSNQEENVFSHNKQEEPNSSQHQEHLSGTEFVEHGSSSVSRLQQLGSSQEGSQLSMQQKDNQLPQKAEHITLQFSQSGGIQMSEQNKVDLSEQDRVRNPDNQKQYPNIQKMDTQQLSATEQPSNNPMARNKQVPFALLLPVIKPHLNKDKVMQLQTLYSKLRRNEINKDDFVRLMRNIVGDQMLRQALIKIQVQQAKDQAAQNSQSGPQQIQKGHRPATDPVHQSGQVKTESSLSITEHNAQNYREMEHLSGPPGMLVNPVSSSNMGMGSQERDVSTILSRGLNKQEHMNLPRSSYPIYGATMSNFHPHTYSGPSMSSSSPFKSQTQDSQTRQAPPHQGMVSTHIGGTSMMSMSKYEMQNSSNDPKRNHFGPLSELTTLSMLQHNPASWKASVKKEQKGSSGHSMSYAKQELLDHTQENPAGRNTVSSSLGTPSETTARAHTQVSSTITSLPGTSTKTPSKKPSIEQKNPLDMPPSLASWHYKVFPDALCSNKKQKVAGVFLDKFFEELNDVTAVSGVNLKEEEEQLLSGPKEESRASEASIRAVQEEEERLILQKAPLRRKLAEIMSKTGIKNMSNDVERCLSLCVEERLRGLISNLIRVSKQRVDIESSRHQTLITSDVRHQILAMNRKAREDWEKKHAEEAEKAYGNTATDGEKDKDEGRTKNLKVNKEEDEKMRTTAANVAARFAVGGDDMLSKWQLMAEQARQKREGGTDMASAGQSGKDTDCRASSSTRAENRGPSTRAASGIARKSGKNSGMSHTKIARTTSVKDVIAVLDREHQMCKSTLLYRLYEKVPSDAPAK